MERYHLAPVAEAWISKSEGREGGGGGSADAPDHPRLQNWMKSTCLLPVINHGFKIH